MRLRRRRNQRERFVSAKDLAEMGFCEKRVLLAHLHGQRMTPEQQRSAERGRRAHERYYREGLSAVASGADRRCFVATCLFGEEAWQTNVLRRDRDEVLLHRRIGRRAVAAYYWCAPRVCDVLARLPWLQRPVRALIEVLLIAVRRRLERPG
ncbi:MAG: hypothetical protein KIT17_09445 [Rubrivivax sp.]|nr:hypothetical protein [Rubrivivax sp.]